MYQEELPLIQSSDALQITPDEIQRLDEILFKSTEPVVQNGSRFLAVGAKVQSIEDVRIVYRKVCVDPYAASANSHIFVNRIQRSDNGQTVENFHDEDEHEAGRRLLHYMRKNSIVNPVVVFTRWMGNAHIGLQRFTVMGSLVNQVAHDLDSG